MKKSLNNKIRGKRLVVGDENEVTSHEMLVEDKDGKIAIKQRGADGKMENVSETITSEYSIYYYTSGSKSDSPLGGQLYIYSQLLPYTTFADMVIKNPGSFNKAKANINIPIDDNIQVTHTLDSSTGIRTFNINVGSGATGVATTKWEEISDMCTVLYLYCQYYTTGGNQSYPFKIFWNLSTYNEDETNKSLYEAPSNTFFFYNTAKGLEININSELADTLQIFTNTNEYPSGVKVNGKERSVTVIPMSR